jgi:hypothetical protein
LLNRDTGVQAKDISEALGGAIPIPALKSMEISQ